MKLSRLLAGLLICTYALFPPLYAASTSIAFPAAPHGPGAGRHLVFLTGDEEYRSEEGLPMLAKILSQRHGFRCTVLFALNPDGTINPDNNQSVPNSEALDSADGIILGLRFRQWPDAAMARFASGQSQLLVATTVIEVGVDVPAATVMVIEHAERFGLAQLHQLRGRVGRGSAKSTCLLLYALPLGETAKARLAIMRETEDGFRIAEEDLRLRGAGELLGTRQSGLPDMRLADLAIHGELLQAARDDARLVIDRDPDLQTERGKALRALLYLFRRDDAVRTLRAG